MSFFISYISKFSCINSRNVCNKKIVCYEGRVDLTRSRIFKFGECNICLEDKNVTKCSNCIFVQCNTCCNNLPMDRGIIIKCAHCKKCF